MSSITTPGYGWASTGVFQKGTGRSRTLAVPMSIHASSRNKLMDLLSANYDATSGLVLLQGGEEQCVYDSDTELVFRQDSWFHYLFGVKEPGMFGLLDLESRKSILFIPRLGDEYRIWCGEIHSSQSFKLSYNVDEVYYTDEIDDYMAKANLSPSKKLYLLNGINSDSGLQSKVADFPSISSYLPLIDNSKLHHALSSARVLKSDYEVEVMRYCAWVASNAHVECMREVHVGMNEYELEAVFAYQIYRKGGCRKCAYTAICACGPNGATLHYGHAGAPNDYVLREGDICLLDMGAEYHGYVSDITCSFPVATEFSNNQKVVYEGVLEAQKAVASLMKPGASWVDCHLAAEREVLRALVTLQVLVNPNDSTGKEEEFLNLLQEKDIGSVFMPHGLGHLIGCDTHDVGGYIEGTPKRVREGPGVGKLRTSRVLEQNMVMTSEPGCYFIDALLDKALLDETKSMYFNVTKLQEMRGFGGVRLEDVVLVTELGMENLTTTPRTIEEVESVRQGGEWPPVEDKAPELKRTWYILGPQGDGMVASPLSPK